MRISVAATSAAILLMAVGFATVLLQRNSESVQASGQAMIQDEGSEPLARMREKCVGMAREGEYRDARSCFENARHRAEALGSTEYSARFLTNIANIDLYSHRLRSAMKGYLAARQYAESADNRELTSALNTNISWVYSMLGADDEASAAIIAAAKAVPAHLRAEHLPRIRMQEANIAARSGDTGRAVEAAAEALLWAERAGDIRMMCDIMSAVGWELLLKGEVERAEPFLIESFRLHKFQAQPVPDHCYRNLAVLEMQRGNLAAALQFINRALEVSGEVARPLPAWMLHYRRALIRRAAGDSSGALSDLEAALGFVQQLRLEMLPAEAIRISAGVELSALYRTYIEVANEVFDIRPDLSLAARSFEAAEGGRALALRASLDEMDEVHDRLPVEYWHTLQQLTDLEQNRIGRRSNEPDASERLRRRLTVMEIEAGLALDLAPAAGRVRLKDIQAGLPGDRALLAFSLSKSFSYLWAVTRDHLELHRLPPGTELEQLCREFQRSVEASSPEASEVGERLYQLLFGDLGEEVRRMRQWDLVPDGALFETPLAALVAERRNGEPVYLIERHTLRMLPSASMLLAAKGTVWEGPAMIVADPVYNTADPRWKFRDVDPALQLTRLAGASREARQCAQVLGMASNRPILLAGMGANARRVRESLAERPAMIHFATHVITVGDHDKKGLIALSLTEDGSMNLLGPTGIGALRTYAGLIVISGCSSGAGEVLPGEGLLGLTRAWLRAGAHSVAATYWPIPDHSGEILQAVYTLIEERKREGLPIAPQEALRQAQIEMIRSGDWRSQTGYWAAYFLIGRS